MARCRKERIPRYGAAVEEGPMKASVNLDINPVVRHASEFMGLRCAADILGLGLFPNGKEVTESMAAFAEARQQLGQERLGDESVLVVDVGCGKQPRTAALFAFRTRWATIGVDPAVQESRYAGERRVRRLEARRARIQDVSIEHEGLAVLTLVHAHVRVIDALRAVEAPEYLVVAIPCCVPHDLPCAPDREFLDWGCWSPQRRVKVWRLDRATRDRLVERSRVEAPGLRKGGPST